MLWGLQAVEQQSAYGLTVEVLRRHVHLGLLLPGERLPPERTLADQLSVSRVTLREALRVMETEGYFVVRRGASGGAFVNDLEVLREISSRRLSRDPAMVMRMLEFREAVEPTAARHAAARRTPTDLAALESAFSAIKAADNSAMLRRAESMFYLALGAASHNPLLSKSIEDAQLAVFVLPAIEPDLDAVRKLLEAIKARNGDQAQDASRALIATDRVRLGDIVGFV
ncbi:FCD domain-containing protein [Pseudomonas sp. B21-056]|jgi:DNA-binding FadR family transcriptional regulator|uniref:FadR/GntR family transcriptional regulator n=1 Tax=Pseudomonas sp. B21-056 TaxID=2895495 RepID=UPI0022316166|nr:FCD domain-containing protein [Pseudomonas sp. B21-056]UZE26121.1 FCD domain-containing protein [Pseudomonas sp. B21-056]